MAWMHARVGIRSPMAMAARHLANRAPALMIRFQSAPESVQTLGYLFARKPRQLHEPGVRLDTGNHAPVGQQPGKRHAAERGRVQRFLEQNDAADKVRQIRCREQQIAIRAPCLRCGFHADVGKTLRDGSHTLVCRQYSSTRGYQCASRGFEFRS